MALFWTMISGCHSCFLSLKNISEVRKVFSNSNYENLFSVFILSRLHYCKGLFAGLSKTSKNSACCSQNHDTYTVIPTYTPVLKSLDRLPVQYRIWSPNTSLTLSVSITNQASQVSRCRSFNCSQI